MRPPLAALALAVLAPLAADALAADPTPFHVGIGAGWSRTDLDGVDARLGTSFGAYNLSRDEDQVGWKVFGGWTPLPWLTVEGGYADYGRAKYDATTQLPTTRIEGRYETSAWFVDVLPTLRVERFAFFGKLGAAFWEAKASATTDVLLGSRLSNASKERGTAFKWGLGASWDFTDRLVGRLEYEQFEAGDDATGKADVGLLALAIAWRF